MNDLTHLLRVLRDWVDLYDTDPATWPDADVPLLTAAYAALGLEMKAPREEYPDHGPTDPWQTSGPGSA